ncbi:MAG TPA: cysteine desulfurase family protein [Syntrophomonas sp.]|nr:cysteine desulfurase family protein [Syntrophomonas sp.]
MDNSATTPVDPEVIQAMTEFLKNNFGNPSSLHSFGEEALLALQTARKQVAQLIGADSSEIVFTSGGTEANNMAIKGAVLAHRERGQHIITSAIEHHAVLNAFTDLQNQGYDLTVLPVNPAGEVEPQVLQQAVREDTVLVSIMHANNEIGTIQDIPALSEICRRRGILFHTDAVQTVGRIPVDVSELKVDLLSLSGHKFYGPKGVGALYIRSGVQIKPLVYGGGQERNLRSGTENMPGIVGLGKAAELAGQEMPARLEKLQQMGQRLFSRIMNEVPGAYLTGHPGARLPGHVSLVFPGVEGRSLLTFLNAEGIAASGGAACSSNSFSASHVLKALQVPGDIADSALRLTLGKDNSLEEVDYVMTVLPATVERMRLLWSLQKE